MRDVRNLFKAGTIRIYYHANCFDGAASAAFLLRFLENQNPQGLIELVPVQYGQNGAWLKQSLEQPALIVDFLFHPEATAWWDHHSTAFLTEGLRRIYSKKKGALFYWDNSLPSCAELLQRHFAESFGYNYPELQSTVAWATIIDAARYRDPQQRIDARDPAIQIDMTFGGLDYNNWLVRQMATKSLEDISKEPELEKRFEEHQKLSKAGTQKFTDGAEFRNCVVAFDVNTDDAIIDRYLAYYFYPEALFSVGLTRSKRGLSVLTMRNPWKKPNIEYPHLGRLCEQFGGGGHQRVGAIKLGPGSEHQAEKAFQRIRKKLEEKCGKAVQPV